MIARNGLDVLRKYDGAVPRYTSYPPAPWFTQEPDAMGALDLIRASNQQGSRNLSFYFHIPFCPSRCLFCGCHTEIGRPGAFIRRYMEALEKELDALLPMLDPTRPITQIHFGGGTPNSVPQAGLGRILSRLSSFSSTAKAEIAIECDPNLMTLATLEDLAALGFTRLSIGIQDFDPEVLAAVNRRFPKTQPKQLFEVARGLGLRGNNLDLIYGLPLQTQASFRIAVAKAIDSDPDRISLFPYAHVPWIKGHQAKLQEYPMPDAAMRLDIAWEARAALLDAGYVAIGMDHYAKPEDELGRAAREGGLHRNFQGYCVRERAGQVYALGASGISQLEHAYLQNSKQLDKYLALAESGKLTHESGYRMRPQDRAVRAALNGILCDGEADLAACARAAGTEPDWTAGWLRECAQALAPLSADGIAHFDGTRVRLTGSGHYAARAVAAAFDPLLKHPAPAGQRYSRTL